MLTLKMSLRLPLQKYKAVNHPLHHSIHPILGWGSPLAYFHTYECHSHLYTANCWLSRNKFKVRIFLSNHTGENMILHLAQESIYSIEYWYHFRFLTSNAQPNLDCILKTSSIHQPDNFLVWYVALGRQNREAISLQI